MTALVPHTAAPHGHVPPAALLTAGPPGAVLALAALLGLTGAVAGAGARWLLGRLRRGVRVPRPWCELGVAVAWGATGAVTTGGTSGGTGAGPSAWLPALLGLGLLAVAASAVDVVHRRLPDALTLPALPLALLLLAPLGAAAVLRGLAAAGVATAAYAAVHLAAPAALGAGDVKLAAPLGAVLGAASWEAVALGALLAAVLSALVAVAAVGRGGGAATPLPHGPAMLGAAWLVATAAAARGP